MNKQDIINIFEISESQSQDPYCVAKQQGQIEGFIKAVQILINTPEIENFIEGLKTEAAHQTEKWGEAHEESKFPQDYSLVLDKLKGKQALAIWDRDIEKYKHHLITMAAVCHNIHRQIDKPGTKMNDYFKGNTILHGDNCKSFFTACKSCLADYFNSKD